MKIILKRNEMRAFKELVETIEEFEGLPVSRDTIMEDFHITKKAYVVSMITGQLAIEINENMILECLAITDQFLQEGTEVFRSLAALCTALSPMFKKVIEQYSGLIERYKKTTESQFNTVSIETEQVNEMEAI